jgi:hypothetical protein
MRMQGAGRRRDSGANWAASSGVAAHVPARPMRAAVCLFVCDEERDIAEWLAFQFAVGFDAVILYDNGSVDRTAEIAQRFLWKHLHVEWTPWARTDADAQSGAYEHCLASVCHEYDWIAFLDADEFLVPHKGNVKSLLRGHADAAAVVCNWMCYGSSGHQTRPAGLLTETFTRRALSSFRPNQIVKFIVRPSKVTTVHTPCMFQVDGKVVTPSGRAPVWKNEWVSTKVFDHEVARLNHYLVKSRAEWEQKMDRGYRDMATDEHRLLFPRFDRNDDEDLCALRFLPAVKKTLAWIEAE